MKPPAAPTRARLRRVIRALLVGLGAASTVSLALPASAAPGAKKPAAGSAKAKRGGKSPIPARKPVNRRPPRHGPRPPRRRVPGNVTVALQIQRATLENGLRVVLNPDHTSPTIAVAIAYDVGSRNEERGKSGFAHLF